MVFPICRASNARGARVNRPKSKKSAPDTLEMVLLGKRSPRIFPPQRAIPTKTFLTGNREARYRVRSWVLSPISARAMSKEEVRSATVSYTHLRAHETKANLVCRLLLEKKKE